MIENYNDMAERKRAKLQNVLEKLKDDSIVRLDGIPFLKPNFY